VKSPWTIEEGALKAEKTTIKGYEIGGFGITNHVHFNSPDQEFLHDLRKEIDSVQEKHPKIQIFLGVELDIDGDDGKFTLLPSTMEIIDYIIAGPHNQIHRCLAWEDLEEDDMEDYFTSLRNRILNGLEKNPVSVWVHPFLQEIEAYADMYWEQLEPIFNAALKILDKKKIAYEINGSWYRTTRQPLIENWQERWASIEAYNAEIQARLKYMLKEASAYDNILFSLGSDAHSYEDFLDIGNSLKQFQKLGLDYSRMFIPQKKMEN